ncbi:hypothetical protein GCM10023190_06900 [Enteractinococcus fodinae]|uniref:HNH nuclease domain-containing protein n=1 Tax=Enteractinococcus fodinae TaxID=684663 RepID=A0ABU2B231_9MICC|nr:HNH endonuclease signature motif containing protein [Enteractinococcus fodinae]MDR7346833.1 hypothetical protein [Enteractinococcus fodinae]
MTTPLNAPTALSLDWAALTAEEIHEQIRAGLEALADREPDAPSNGALQRSMLLEATLRRATAVQYQYTGLLKDAFNDPKLRHTLGLPEGKTAFRDATDLLAKTHGIRANEAAGRMRLAAAMTPARASDPDRAGSIGHTRLPLLGALQGRVNPSKLSSALAMIDEVEANAEAAGKDEAFRTKLRKVIEKDFAEKIEHTTPEEFSRYVGQRKKDLLASIDPSDKQFTARQTEAMHDVRRIGLVRGNKNAVEWRLITDAEGDERLQTLLAAALNPRGKNDGSFETRSRGQRRMHVLRDALSFVLANFDKAGFRGASGAHTQMLVITDYATLLEGLRREFADLLPELQVSQREALLQAHAESHTGEAEVEVRQLPSLPSAQTTRVDELLEDQNLDRLQQRISQGIYNNYIPPDVILRMRCDVGLTPVTLTGQRQVLSVGRQQRQFNDALRRAIMARDRGCAVPGCHMPASMCEVHHVTYWSRGGETSTENGVLLCSHHHQAVHAGALKISRVDGEFRFILHPLLDPDQVPRKNYFYQT